ncbi:uncharacterized protein LOC110239934 [Exaiptasia diaphana]|uniref:FMN-dependent NADH-azoreductase n=1 Tax=Exaiptasia diaphana TaxID=2652724 RepID=A0A913X9Y4_EXADI|nr:uncharacterized protein LOC110239934 [Exaiptasia diaphana]
MQLLYKMASRSAWIARRFAKSNLHGKQKVLRSCSYVPAFRGEVKSQGDVRKNEHALQILHLNCSGSDDRSWTGIGSETFFKSYKKIYPHHKIKEINLWDKDLLKYNLSHVASKMRMVSGEEQAGDKENLTAVEDMITTLYSADKLVISSPMWNYGVPYVLKQYIDCIVQPGLTFQETQNGPRGLVTGRPLLLITSSGGDYTKPGMVHLDFQVPYLKVIFALIGFTNVRHIYIKNTSHDKREHLLQLIYKSVSHEVKQF